MRVRNNFLSHQVNFHISDRQVPLQGELRDRWYRRNCEPGLPPIVPKNPLPRPCLGHSPSFGTRLKRLPLD
jgi:hypothetical protein